MFPVFISKAVKLPLAPCVLYLALVSILFFHCQHGAQTQRLGGFHHFHDALSICFFMCINDNGSRCIVITLPHGVADPGAQGVQRCGLGAHEKLLGRIDGNDNGLFGFRIAFCPGYGKLDHIRIGQCGNDEKEEKQNEKNVIQCAGMRLIAATAFP